MYSLQTLLSMAKLAALASDDVPDVLHNNMELINTEHDLIEQQEQLPQDVLEVSNHAILFYSHYYLSSV